jgi:hypothetical protein
VGRAVGVDRGVGAAHFGGGGFAQAWVSHMLGVSGAMAWVAASTAVVASEAVGTARAVFARLRASILSFTAWGRKRGSVHRCSGLPISGA